MKDLNKWRQKSYSCVVKLNVIKMPILLKLINAITEEVLVDLFLDIDKLTPKSIWKAKDLEKKRNFKNKQREGIFFLIVKLA